MYEITRFLVGVARQLGIPLRRPVQILIRVPVQNYSPSRQAYEPPGGNDTRRNKKNRNSKI